MKKQTFENFLQDVFIANYPYVLDDDITDKFDAWLGNKDVNDFLEWAELYGKSQYLAGKKEILTK